MKHDSWVNAPPTTLGEATRALGFSMLLCPLVRLRTDSKIVVDNQSTALMCAATGAASSKRLGALPLKATGGHAAMQEDWLVAIRVEAETRFYLARRLCWVHISSGDPQADRTFTEIETDNTRAWCQALTGSLHYSITQREWQDVWSDGFDGEVPL